MRVAIAPKLGRTETSHLFVWEWVQLVFWFHILACLVPFSDFILWDVVLQAPAKRPQPNQELEWTLTYYFLKEQDINFISSEN